MKEAKISNFQLALLIFAVFYGSIAITNPAFGAKSDAWIAVIIGFIGGLILVTMFLYVSKLNSGQTLTEILENCFGKVLGKIISICYILFYLYKSSINTRLFGGFMAGSSYTDTPIIVLYIAFSIGVLYCLRGGLSNIGRVSEILVPIIPISAIVISTSIFTMMDFSGFTPVLEDITPVIKSAFRIISIIFGDIFICLFIIPYTNNENGRFKATYWTILSFEVLLMLLTVRNIIVVGPSLMVKMTYPSSVAAQMIPSININPLIDISLLVGAGLKVVILLYAVSKIISDLFRLEEYKPIQTALVILNIALAYCVLPQNGAVYPIWSKSYGDDIIAFPFHVLLPLIILIISIIKNRKKIIPKALQPQGG